MKSPFFLKGRIVVAIDAQAVYFSNAGSVSRSEKDFR